MYRATLIFSYSFSFWGIILTFWYPIPLPQLTRGVFPALFRLSIPSLDRSAGYFLPFPALYTLSALTRGVFPALSGSLYPPSVGPWGITRLLGFPYPHNAGISCMSFSYNTQDSIGKRFPQPFL